MNRDLSGLTPLILEWNKRTIKAIPAGTQLFSKSNQLFGSAFWPTYYSKARGFKIWDISSRCFIDMSYMGVGACVLGYADSDVNKSVIKSIRAGVQSTLIAREELILAEKIIALHPWSEMVRFAKSGHEAAALAVRIARASTNREKVAFSGYHGSADWYLAANLNEEDSLSQYLFSGISAAGIPSGLKGTALPFRFNDFESMRSIFAVHGENLAALIVEPCRSEEPLPGFLEELRLLSTRYGVVLIFDEITSGWRHGVGGVHLKFNVYPDIAIFAKSMGNGFPISCIIGRPEIMKEFNNSFVSSTNWSERSGFAASIATMDKFERENVSEYISSLGLAVIKSWEECAKSYGISVTTSSKNLSALASFRFNHPFSRGISLYFTREMLRFGWLAAQQFKPSLAHNQSILTRYSNKVDEVFERISKQLSIGDLTPFQELERSMPPVGIPRLTT